MSQPVVVQVVRNGVPVNGARAGDNDINVLLDISFMDEIVPGSELQTAFKVGFSGDQFNDYVGVSTLYSGSQYGQDVIVQFQASNPYGAGKNLKGNVQNVIQEFGAGNGGLVGLLPDSVIVPYAQLVANAGLYIVLKTDGGGVFGWNSPSTNVWLWYYPISQPPA
jgi:hypothetical protein